MIVDLPSCSTRDIVKRLIALRNEVGAMAMGRVLTLVVSVDEEHADEAIRVANDATRQHPARIVVLVAGNSRGAGRLDAQIRIGGDAGASEIVVLRRYGALARQEAAVLTPLLLPDSPVVAWWPCGGPADVAGSPLGQIAQRRITDAGCGEKASTELRRRATHYRPGDTDLSWTRLTRWRALLATTLDAAPLEPVTAAAVTAQEEHPDADLLAGWLAHALGIPVRRVRSGARSGLVSVRLERASGPIDLVRTSDGEDTATLVQPLNPARLVALHTPAPAETLAEELRRLDPDEIYAGALAGLAKVRRGGTRAEEARAGTVPAAAATVPASTTTTVTSGRLSRVKPAEGPAQDEAIASMVGEALRRSARPVTRVHQDTASVATAVVDELLRRLVGAVEQRGVAHVALTGGSMGTAVMQALSARAGEVPASVWRCVHLWWGDERFVAADDPDRNDVQADQAGMGELPVMARNVHRVPAAESTPPSAMEIEAAALRYAAELATWAPAPEGDADVTVAVPRFDVLMLGVGPDAHVASLFPGSAQLDLSQVATAAVTDSPKPPPARVTLTLPALDRAAAVWLVVSGAEKADAVARALKADDDHSFPASCVHGHGETVWWLDEAAAAQATLD